MGAMSPSAILDLAEQHFAAGRLAEAEPLFRRVLGVSGDDVHVLHVLGYIARQQGRPAAAVESYAAAVALDPENAQLHNNLGDACQALGDNEAAIASYRRAVDLAPDEAAIHFNLGALLQRLHRMDEAVVSLERSIALRRDIILTRSEICPVLCSLGRYEDALVHYRAGLAIEPDNATARYLEALALLALGDFEGGWEAHEVRWRSELGANRRRVFPQPYWLGQQFAPGQTILLHAEQGLGDTLQFVRYAPLVAARGARVLLEVQPEVAPLLHNVPGVARLYVRGDALPSFDWQSSLMSMPRAFRTTIDTVPNDMPYLTPPSDRVAMWRERLGPPIGMRIGIAWSGTPEPWNRAISLALLAPLMEREGCEFHVLQTDILPADRVTLDGMPQVRDHSHMLADFADTAAVVSLMDLVISIDTATAHLAGALGKPVWTMLPLGPDYRWMLHRPDNPWYPTMRLFRQSALHDWASVVVAVTHALDVCYPDVVFEIAHQAYLQGRSAEAKKFLKPLMGIGWRDAYVSYFIGHLEFLLNNVETAVGYLQAAVEMDPNHARAHNDLGEALRVLGRCEEAELILKRAIELEPTLAYPYGNLGAVLHALNRDDEALDWLQQSLQLAGDRAIAHCDLGATLAWLNRHEEAIEHYRVAQQIQPDFARAEYSESLSLLSLGRFEEGWLKHEARLRDMTHAHVRRASPEPAWHGEPNIAGKTILLHAEQGHGDAIQFVRYVPYVAAKGAVVLLQVSANLKSLFAGLLGIASIFSSDAELPPIDLQCSLMSLPYALRHELNTIPAAVPYLAVDPTRATEWRERLEPRRRMRIGIAWSGSRAHANDRNRSMPLGVMARLLSRTDIEFHVLQADIREQDRDEVARLGLHDHSAVLRNFMDTAALALQMELLITVDTALAHVGGGLGVPTWVMLAWASDWRWLLDRSDSPWYPTVRLFRQQRRGDWPSVLQQVARALDTQPITR